MEIAKRFAGTFPTNRRKDSYLIIIYADTACCFMCYLFYGRTGLQPPSLPQQIGGRKSRPGVKEGFIGLVSKGYREGRHGL